MLTLMPMTDTLILNGFTGVGVELCTGWQPRSFIANTTIAHCAAHTRFSKTAYTGRLIG